MAGPPRFLPGVAMTTDTGESGWLSPKVIATLMGVCGMAASVTGNELSIRTSRVRLIRFAMVTGILFAVILGYWATFSYELAPTLVIGYGIIIWLDSSSLTAGTAGSAEPSRRGATLAVNSMLGNTGGFAGLVVTGGCCILPEGHRSSAGLWRSVTSPSSAL